MAIAGSTVSVEDIVITPEPFDLEATTLTLSPESKNKPEPLANSRAISPSLAPAKKLDILPVSANELVIAVI